MIHGGHHRHTGPGITGARRGRLAGTHGGVHRGHGVGSVPDGVLPGARHGDGARDVVLDGVTDGAVWHGAPEPIHPMDASLRVSAMVIPV